MPASWASVRPTVYTGRAQRGCLYGSCGPASSPTPSNSSPGQARSASPGTSCARGRSGRWSRRRSQRRSRGPRRPSGRGLLGPGRAMLGTATPTSAPTISPRCLHAPSGQYSHTPGMLRVGDTSERRRAAAARMHARLFELAPRARGQTPGVAARRRRGPRTTTSRPAAVRTPASATGRTPGGCSRGSSGAGCPPPRPPQSGRRAGPQPLQQPRTALPGRPPASGLRPSSCARLAWRLEQVRAGRACGSPAGVLHSEAPVLC